MRETTLDTDHDGLIVLVADDGALQNAFRHILRSLSLGFCRLLAGNGFDARNVLADFIDARGLFELAGRLLEAQVELLLLQLGKLFVELIGAECANGLRLSLGFTPYSAMR